MEYDSEEYLNYVVGLDHEIEKRDQLFVYKGYVDQEVTKFFANQVKDRLDEEGMEYLLANRVYHIMVECFQNIIRHSAGPKYKEDEISGIRGYMSVSRHVIDSDDELYVVTTGNAIQYENVEPLKAWLDKINDLDQDGLKQLYKTILRENKLNNSGGAGLGFVDMKKRTKNKIDYHIAPMKNGHYYLVLSVRIKTI